MLAREQSRGHKYNSAHTVMKASLCVLKLVLDLVSKKGVLVSYGRFISTESPFVTSRVVSYRGMHH